MKSESEKNNGAESGSSPSACCAFALPWRHESYKAALGHEVNRVMSFDGKQVFAGSNEECAALVRATSQDAAAIKAQIESKFAAAITHAHKERDRIRERMNEETGKLTETIYDLREKIEELQKGPCMDPNEGRGWF